MNSIRSILEERRGVLRSLRQRRFLIVFNWHQVAPEFDSIRHHEYTWTRLDDFEREVEWLASKYEILPLSKALDCLRKDSWRGRCAALTFDDGDVSMAECLLPLMKRRGWPATFFVNSGYLENHCSYWFPIANYFRANPAAAQATGFSAELLVAAGKLRRTSDPTYYDEWRNRIEMFASSVPDLAARLVSTDWLSKLDGDQFVIGAHGHEHERFSMMSGEWQRNNLRENIRILSQFRAYRPIFAVPFGRKCDWTPETVAISSGLGLEVLLAEGGINKRPADFYRRIPSDGKQLRPLINAALAPASFFRNENRICS